MNTNKLKELGKNIIAIAEDIECTDDKGRLNDLYIGLDLNIEELNEVK